MTPPPEDVLDCMCRAMIEPDLILLGKEAKASGNVFRAKVLLRALEMAEIKGWTLQPTKEIQA